MKTIEKTTRWHVKQKYNDDEKLIFERLLIGPIVKSAVRFVDFLVVVCRLNAWAVFRFKQFWFEAIGSVSCYVIIYQSPSTTRTHTTYYTQVWPQ